MRAGTVHQLFSYSADFVGWNPDPVVGREMLATTASALVEVPWDAEFFTLVDGVATPVHTSQWH